MELTDEQPIQRSWLENESHEALAFSDRAYWTKRIYETFTTPEYSGKDALELAARYLGVTLPTVMRYFGLAGLPDDLMPLVDGGTLPVGTSPGIWFTDGYMSRSLESTPRMGWLLIWANPSGHTRHRCSSKHLWRHEIVNWSNQCTAPENTSLSRPHVKNWWPGWWAIRWIQRIASVEFANWCVAAPPLYLRKKCLKWELKRDKWRYSVSEANHGM